MSILLKALFWFTLALVFALIEIENEGKYGWAEKTQTWYRTSNHHKGSVLLKLLVGRKPLTGYHIFIFFAALLISHAHFFMGTSWSLAEELASIAVWLSWAPLWDNLWFIFNPYYGLGNDLIKKVWWYKHTVWIAGLFPLENAIQWLAAIGVSYLAFLVSGSFAYFTNQLIFLAYLFGISAIATFTLAPLYKKWNKEMRGHDDRKKAGIYH